VTEFTGTDAHEINALVLLFWLYGLSTSAFTYCLT
jgi:hypothetical protein